MHSKERIAQALEQAGCHPDMIQHARDGWFDDFESMLPMPKYALAKELRDMNRPLLAERVERGEFANTKEESEAWYAEHGENEGNELFKGPGFTAPMGDPGGRFGAR